MTQLSYPEEVTVTWEVLVSAGCLTLCACGSACVCTCAVCGVHTSAHVRCAGCTRVYMGVHACACVLCAGCTCAVCGVHVCARVLCVLCVGCMRVQSASASVQRQMSPSRRHTGEVGMALSPRVCGTSRAGLSREHSHPGNQHVLSHPLQVCLSVCVFMMLCHI